MTTNGHPGVMATLSEASTLAQIAEHLRRATGCQAGAVGGCIWIYLPATGIGWMTRKEAETVLCRLSDLLYELVKRCQ